MRLHLLLVEYLAHRALHQLGEAQLSLSLLARMASQQSRRPQFVRIAQFLRSAGQRHQACLGLGGDRRLLARSRAIIECRHRAIGHRPVNAALGMRLPGQPGKIVVALAGVRTTPDEGAAHIAVAGPVGLVPDLLCRQP